MKVVYTRHAKQVIARVHRVEAEERIVLDAEISMLKNSATSKEYITKAKVNKNFFIKMQNFITLKLICKNFYGSGPKGYYYHIPLWT